MAYLEKEIIGRTRSIEQHFEEKTNKNIAELILKAIIRASDNEENMFDEIFPTIDYNILPAEYDEETGKMIYIGVQTDAVEEINEKIKQMTLYCLRVYKYVAYRVRVGLMCGGGFDDIQSDIERSNNNIIIRIYKQRAEDCVYTIIIPQ